MDKLELTVSAKEEETGKIEMRKTECECMVAFAYSNIRNTENGIKGDMDVVIAGKSYPSLIMISEGVRAYIHQRHKETMPNDEHIMREAYDLHNMAEVLEKKSNELLKSTSNENREFVANKVSKEAIDEIIKALQKEMKHRSADYIMDALRKGVERENR